MSYKLFNSKILNFSSLVLFDDNKDKSIYVKKLEIYVFTSLYDNNFEDIIFNSFFLNSRCMSRQYKNKLQ